VVATIFSGFLSLAEAQSVDPADSLASLDNEKKELEIRKLELEIENLSLESANKNRDLTTSQGRTNLIFSFGVPVAAFITAGTTAVFAIIGWYSNKRGERAEKEEQRLDNEEQRFHETIKSLGGKYKERINAVSELSIYISPEFERFHKRLFNNVLGNLKLGNLDIESPENSKSSDTKKVDSDSDAEGDKFLEADPVNQVFSLILKEMYPFMRDRVLFPYRRSLFLRKEKIDDNERKKIIEQDKSRPTLASMMAQKYDCTGLHLEGTYLAGADFKYAWMRGSHFNCSILKNAKFLGANLEGSDFSSNEKECRQLTNLQNAIFSHATLIRGKFENAELQNANMKSSNCHDARFENAKLCSADLYDANLYKCEFPDADLTSANLSRATLDKAKLINTICKSTDFTGASFKEATLENIEFINVSFSEETSFEAATFKKVKMKNVSGLTETQKVFLMKKEVEFE
jgi:uncharacterized protein YjbI with pentapeptide repeats